MVCICCLKIVFYLEREGVSYYWHLTFVGEQNLLNICREHGIEEFTTRCALWPKLDLDESLICRRMDVQTAQ